SARGNPKKKVKGIKDLLSLKPDIAIMEPTGINYQKVWGNILAQNGVEVRLISHRALSTHRDHLDLPDKEDETDSFALAHYGLQNLNNKSKFLTIREQPINRIRELCLRLEHLNRVQNPIINRMRQDLAWQFPEISQRQIRRKGYTVPIFYRWLAEESQSKKYDREYSETVGLGLTDDVRLHAQRLCDLQREEIKIEKELDPLINDPQFFSYRKVFTEFRFGFRHQAILISQIYPFENFLGEDGKPIVVFKRSTKKSKNSHTKRYLSRRRFEKMLGVAPTENSSGNQSKKKVVGGSSLCRKLFWQWIYTSVQPMQARKNNPILCEIHEWMNRPKLQGTPYRLLMMKTASHAARLLFKRLVEELT
ncbi:transposase, partial [Cyanothece sp. BG0011]|uniref:IS110 family transposase n=1 Tax=Cyanothece sp. BG0011 TaxID=2082950 RepID=UPI000D1F234B